MYTNHYSNIATFNINSLVETAVESTSTILTSYTGSNFSGTRARDVATTPASLDTSSRDYEL